MGAKVDKDGLTENEKKFCRAYVANGGHGTNAAIDAGYAIGSATVTGSKLLTKTNVRKYIDAWREKYEFKTIVSVEKQLKRLEMITSVQIGDYITISKKGAVSFKPMEEWSEAMKYAVEGYSYNSKGKLQLKLQGKNWAADMINKHLGIYEKDNRQQNGVQIHLPGRDPMELTKEETIAQDSNTEPV